MIFPPLDVDWPDGERVHCDICPVRYCSQDIADLFRAYTISGGHVSVSEMDSLPNPYIEAWELVAIHLPQARQYRARGRHG